ncbi:1350_t:CDS:2, partial [Gigaspora rosea]
ELQSLVIYNLINFQTSGKKTKRGLELIQDCVNQEESFFYHRYWLYYFLFVFRLRKSQSPGQKHGECFKKGKIYWEVNLLVSEKLIKPWNRKNNLGSKYHLESPRAKVSLRCERICEKFIKTS